MQIVGHAIHITRRALVPLAATCMLLAFSATSAFASPWGLDPSFDTDGKVKTDVSYGGGRDMQVQSDGKIVVVGSSFGDEAVARYNPDGSLDTSFGGDGMVTTDYGGETDGGRAVQIQPDGKIVVVGGGLGENHSGPPVDWYSYYGFSVARYNTNGSLDTDFGTGGKVTTEVGTQGNAVALQIDGDGKLVVAGYVSNIGNADFAVVRYNSDGSVDTDFDTDGKVTTAFGAGNDFPASVSLQSDGKLVVAGYGSNGSDADFAAARYDTDGSLDTDFDSDGKVTTDFGADTDIASSVIVQSDGKLVLAGSSFNGSNSDFAVARYDTDGSLDTSFDSDGKMTTDFSTGSEGSATSVVMQSDDKLVVAGYTYNGSNNDFAVARFNADGSLDTDFDNDGKITADLSASNDIAFAVEFQSDGKLVVAGTSDNETFSVARFMVDPPFVESPPANLPPASPLPTPVTPTPLSATVSALGRRIPAKKLKSLTGTAAGTGIAKVEIALNHANRALLKRGKCQFVGGPNGRLMTTRAMNGKCKPTKWLKATGTTSWQFKLTSKLTPGKYKLYARSVGSVGETQTAFDAISGNLRAFTVVR